MSAFKELLKEYVELQRVNDRLQETIQRLQDKNHQMREGSYTAPSMSQTFPIPAGTSVKINPSFEELAAKLNADMPTTEPMRTIETIMVDKVEPPVKRINKV